jgi:hypothetical protein
MLEGQAWEYSRRRTWRGICRSQGTRCAEVGFWVGCVYDAEEDRKPVGRRLCRVWENWWDMREILLLRKGETIFKTLNGWLGVAKNRSKRLWVANMSCYIFSIPHCNRHHLSNVP